jgi:hypothetical protein
MAIAQKKTVVRQFDGSLTWGYLPQGGFVSGETVELLDPAGRVSPLLLNTIKTIAYVKDFNLDNRTDPEQVGRRSFLSRPRADGLWLKLEFRDKDVLEGLANFDLGFIESLLEDRGLTISPPDARSNTQRLFIPRAALISVQVLGFIGALSKQKTAERAAATIQTRLFGE